MVTLVCVAVSRVCFLTPIPGLDHRFVGKFLQTDAAATMGDPFGSFLTTPGNLFICGLSPLVYASMFVSLYTALNPTFKEEMKGPNGNRMVKEFTSQAYAVFVTCLVSSPR